MDKENFAVGYALFHIEIKTVILKISVSIVKMK
jgi:hypothetical protein